MNELQKLKKYLDEHDYENEWANIFGSCDQIRVYKNGQQVWDVICHKYSYGGKHGLLEGYGMIFEGAEGYLTAKEVINRLEKTGD